MKRSSRIITFFIVTALTYGSLFAIVGPEKVRDWHKEHHRYHRYHHDHNDHHDYDREDRKEEQSENEVEEL